MGSLIDLTQALTYGSAYAGVNGLNAIGSANLAAGSTKLYGYTGSLNMFSDLADLASSAGLS